MANVEGAHEKNPKRLRVESYPRFQNVGQVIDMMSKQGTLGADEDELTWVLAHQPEAREILNENCEYFFFLVKRKRGVVFISGMGDGFVEPPQLVYPQTPWLPTSRAVLIEV